MKKKNATDHQTGQFQVGVGAFIELNQSGQLLLLERPKDSVHRAGWEIVYGRLQQGEDMQQALQREVAEETGLQQVGVEQQVSTWHTHRDPLQADSELVGVSFWCHTTTSEITISAEHTAWQWVAIDQVEPLITHTGILQDFRTFKAYRAQYLELLQQQDKALRAMADYQNVLRRQHDERRTIIKAANSDLLDSLIEPLDHLQLAAAQLNDAGLTMVLKQLLETLRNQGLEIIDPLNAPFSVETMEAVDKQGEGQTVTAVVTKGYRYNGQVLRHAKVVVG